MPRYRIRLTNSEFESFDEGEFESLDAAMRMAISAATKVVAEAVASEGSPSSAVEVQICEGETMVARNVVTLSVADLSGGHLPS